MENKKIFLQIHLRYKLDLNNGASSDDTLPFPKQKTFKAILYLPCIRHKFHCASPEVTQAVLCHDNCGRKNTKPLSINRFPNWERLHTMTVQAAAALPQDNCLTHVEAHYTKEY